MLALNARLLATIVVAAVLAAPLGGCVSNDDTPNLFTKVKRDPDDPDKPKRACEYTSEGGAPKTVCY